MNVKALVQKDKQDKKGKEERGDMKCFVKSKQKGKTMADRRTAVDLVPLNFKGPTFCHFLYKSVCVSVTMKASLTEEE